MHLQQALTGFFRNKPRGYLGRREFDVEKRIALRIGRLLRRFREEFEMQIGGGNDTSSLGDDFQQVAVRAQALTWYCAVYVDVSAKRAAAAAAGTPHNVADMLLSFAWIAADKLFGQ